MPWPCPLCPPLRRRFDASAQVCARRPPLCVRCCCCQTCLPPPEICALGHWAASTARSRLFFFFTATWPADVRRQVCRVASSQAASAERCDGDGAGVPACRCAGLACNVEAPCGRNGTILEILTTLPPARLGCRSSPRVRYRLQPCRHTSQLPSPSTAPKEHRSTLRAQEQRSGATPDSFTQVLVYFCAVATDARRILRTRKGNPPDASHAPRKLKSPPCHSSITLCPPHDNQMPTWMAKCHEEARDTRRVARRTSDHPRAASTRLTIRKHAIQSKPRCAGLRSPCRRPRLALGNPKATPRRAARYCTPRMVGRAATKPPANQRYGHARSRCFCWPRNWLRPCRAPMLRDACF